MVPLKSEETLHNYLRRHFEKVSKGIAREFAEQREHPGLNGLPIGVPPMEGKASGPEDRPMEVDDVQQFRVV
jgi:hypothetical protein